MSKNKRIFKIAQIVAALSFSTTSSVFAQQQYVQYTDSETGSEVIVGKINLEQLSEIEGFENLMINESFAGKAAQLEELKFLLDNVEIKAYIGTWCEDSQYHFPQIISLLSHADYDVERIPIIGLNRDKKMMDKSNPPYEVQYVPTLIFFRDGREIGRFVESPQKSLMDDFLKILKN